jgi:antitoxin HigA-1
VSAEMAVRLGKAFGTDPAIWLKLQMQRDLWTASRKKLKVTRLTAKSAA